MEPEPNISRPQLTDEQWLLISEFFPVPSPDPRGGRPRADPRLCLEGILLQKAIDRVDDELFEELLQRGIIYESDEGDLMMDNQFVEKVWDGANW